MGVLGGRREDEGVFFLTVEGFEVVEGGGGGHGALLVVVVMVVMVVMVVGAKDVAAWSGGAGFQGYR